MSQWSFDILRQTGWDWWVVICTLAAGVLVSYALVRRLWRVPVGWIALLCVGLGAGGTIAVLTMPSLHDPFVGLIWTFAVLVLLSATFYLNLQPQLGAGRMLVLLGLRVLALALLVPMLFEPVVRFITRPRPERPLVVMVDASGSMSFPDVQNGPTRIQSVWQVLRPQLGRINDHFIPSYFTFHTDVKAVKKPDDLGKAVADGRATDILGAINKVLREAGDLRPDAAIVLISDGIDNTSPAVAETLRAQRRPVHTVRVGSEQTEPAALANVAVDNVETTDDFVVDHESKVRVTVRSAALNNRVVEVKLGEVDAAGKPKGKFASATLVLKPDPAGQVVDLPFKPAAVGVQRLAAWIDPIAGERSTVDNRQEFQGLALDPRIKVLYIEGRVRPEYTQLNRALARDPNVEVSSLLRITADRFAASGTVNGEAFERMPASADRWSRFDVVIIGDLDSSFINKLQQAAIEQYILKGGGLLMMGGQNTFGPGGYQDTPIEKALPVFTGDLKSPQERTPFIPKLTEAGQAHPALEGLSAWFDGTHKDAKDFKPLLGNVVVPRPKAGAQVLLVHADRPGPDGQPQIVLATQRYGEGRSAALTADTTYLWYLRMRGMGQDSPYNQFWGQLVRWLAGEDVRNRSRGAGLDGLLNKSMYQLGESVRVRAMVRDERGDATRFASVNLAVRRADGKDARQFPLNPVESRAGLYDVTIPNPDKGDWVIELSASKDGKPLDRQELKFTVIPPAEELLKIAANPSLLRDIAQQTRGFHYELAQLPNLLEDLIRSGGPAPTARQETVPLANTLRAMLAWIGSNPQWPTRYDLPMQAGLIVVMLAAEWSLRRRWQLP